MNGKDAVKAALQSTMGMVPMYLGDLSDADLLVRPVPNANHTAWQLGHLIFAEVKLITDALPTAKYPSLPEGYAGQHGKETAHQDPPTGFASKADYINLFNQVRGATLAALETVSEADLDKPTTGPLAPYAPTLGAMFILVSNHVLMHLGQVTVVRRKLGKPVMF